MPVNQAEISVDWGKKRRTWQGPAIISGSAPRGGISHAAGLHVTLFSAHVPAMHAPVATQVRRSEWTK
jgi:hypothetical protein